MIDAADPKSSPSSASPSEPIRRTELPQDPLALFDQWLRAAEEATEIRYPGAMCLSTVDPEGRPQGRFVIAHRIDRSLVFLTDDRSPKARALAANPQAALTAYWGGTLELQVRIEGVVKGTPAAIADLLFGRRPRRSQATPWASRQSEPTTLEELNREMERVEGRWTDRESLPRPDHWRAFRLAPDLFEFWWARPRRLHDRFRYRLEENGGWRLERLSP